MGSGHRVNNVKFVTHDPSSSRSRTFIACSFGLRPPLSSHASILLRRTSCDVAGAFTVTVSRVADPGAFAVNPQRRNSAIASAAASYSELARDLDSAPDLRQEHEKEQRYTVI